MATVLVGLTGIIALCFSIFINLSHLHLRSHSTVARVNKLQTRAANVSHASLILVGMGPLFLCFSYFHPEKLFDDSACLCRVWFTSAVLAYVIGVYLIKTVYFMNILMLQSTLRVTRTHIALKLSILSVFLMGVSIIVLQIIVLDATCKPDDQFGCDISFAAYS